MNGLNSEPKKLVDRIHPDLRETFLALPPGGLMTRETVQEVRAMTNSFLEKTLEAVPASKTVSIEKKMVPGLPGEPCVLVAIYRPVHTSEEKTPGILDIHGGGMISCNITQEEPTCISLVEQMNCTVVCPEYRLSPESVFPAALNDCYAAFLWMVNNADELNIQPEKICVSGGSAGGCLAAAVSIKARDENGPRIMGQFLSYPMLDYRNTTPSSYEEAVYWTREQNIIAWSMYLGTDKPEHVSALASPAMLQDYSNLPPALIIIGTVDVFRDESIAYAQNLMQAGVDVELHVVPGVFHGAESYAPSVGIAQKLNAIRSNSIRRFLESGCF